MRLFIFMLLLPLISNAQTLQLDFAAEVFEACKTNDKERFQEFLASPAELTIFIKDIDPTAPDNQIAPAYDRYKSRAIKGFEQLQQTVADLELDLKTFVITKTEAEDREIELKKDGNPIKTVSVTGMKIFFSCSGKKLCFIISDAIKINDKYYLGNDPVQLHWVD